MRAAQPPASPREGERVAPGRGGTKLDGDQRFAACAAVALLITMFLPWYEKSVVVAGSRSFATDTISAFGAVSFVEAAIFLVAAGVVVLVLTRAEGGRYHLPGGDGTVIFAAGLWASALIFYRVFDRPDVSGDGGTVGIQWGFFVAFVAAGALAFAGRRMRVAARPEPPVREPRPGRRSAPRRRTGARRRSRPSSCRRRARAPRSCPPATRAPRSSAGRRDARTEIVPHAPEPTPPTRRRASPVRGHRATAPSGARTPSSSSSTTRPTRRRCPATPAAPATAARLDP